MDVFVKSFLRGLGYGVAALLSFYIFAFILNSILTSDHFSALSQIILNFSSR